MVYMEAMDKINDLKQELDALKARSCATCVHLGWRYAIGTRETKYDYCERPGGDFQGWMFQDPPFDITKDGCFRWEGKE